MQKRMIIIWRKFLKKLTCTGNNCPNKDFESNQKTIKWIDQERTDKYSSNRTVGEDTILS